MKKTCKLDDNRFLRHDGSNLASMLYLLKQKYEPSYRDIRNAVQLVAPFFEDFLLEPLRLGPDTIRLLWKHKSSDETLRRFFLVGRYTAIHCSRRFAAATERTPANRCCRR